MTRRFLRDNRGAALVEFAIVALMLVTLVFGILEYGMLMKDSLTLTQAAREGARSASLGEVTSIVTDRVVNGAPVLGINRGNVTLRKWSSTAGTPPEDWNNWTPLTNEGGHNDAAPGDYILVHVTYQHQGITGLFFRNRTLSGDMVMRRG